MRSEPAFIVWKIMQLLPDGWTVAATTSFDMVLGRFLLVSLAVGGLVFIWHLGKDFPKNTDLERGMAYFVMLGVCGLGSFALRACINLDVTWTWVAFLSTGAASFAGMISGYQYLDRDNKRKTPSAKKISPIKTTVVFLIAVAAAFLVFKGYFLLLGYLISICER